MNLSFSSLALFWASAAAAHSAQDIIASPRIAKLLATHQDDGDYACMGELSELVDCVGGWEGECVTCIGNAFAGLTNHTCDDLEGTSICSDLEMCIEGPCAIEHCIAPAVALELCEEENEVEDVCPGLCDGGHDDYPVCDGQPPENYCDCGGDCTAHPDWCACEEAQACCEGALDTVVCDGQPPENYCDCSYDCFANPDWCACEEAQECCEGAFNTGSWPMAAEN